LPVLEDVGVRAVDDMNAGVFVAGEAEEGFDSGLLNYEREYSGSRRGWRATIPVDRRSFSRIILVAHAALVGSAEDEPVIQIISARKATPAERKLYEENSAD
jgi:uncharacterized DUF497 family protein